MAVERVREGEKPSAVIVSYGFCRTTIYKWLNTTKGRGRGLSALRSRKGTGRPRKLTAAQERKFFVGSTARIRVNMVLILVCGRVRSWPNWLLTGLASG